MGLLDVQVGCDPRLDRGWMGCMFGARSLGTGWGFGGVGNVLGAGDDIRPVIGMVVIIRGLVRWFVDGVCLLERGLVWEGRRGVKDL